MDLIDELLNRLRYRGYALYVPGNLLAGRPPLEQRRAIIYWNPIEASSKWFDIVLNRFRVGNEPTPLLPIEDFRTAIAWEEIANHIEYPKMELQMARRFIVSPIGRIFDIQVVSLRIGDTRLPFSPDNVGRALITRRVFAPDEIRKMRRRVEDELRKNPLKVVRVADFLRLK